MPHHWQRRCATYKLKYGVTLVNKTCENVYGKSTFSARQRDHNEMKIIMTYGRRITRCPPAGDEGEGDEEEHSSVSQFVLLNKLLNSHYSLLHVTAVDYYFAAAT